MVAIWYNFLVNVHAQSARNNKRPEAAIGQGHIPR